MKIKWYIDFYFEGIQERNNFLKMVLMQKRARKVDKNSSIVKKIGSLLLSLKKKIEYWPFINCWKDYDLVIFSVFTSIIS